MYNNASVGVGGTAAGTALAATGTNIMWAALAGFALIALGLAAMRILPKFRKRDSE